MVRAANRAVARAEIAAVTQFCRKSDVESLLSSENKGKMDDKLKIVKDQLKIYRDLLGMGMKAVPMSHSIDVPEPGGKVKKKKLTGAKLLEWLCGNLLQLMGKNVKEDGFVTPWRDLLKQNSNCGANMVLSNLAATYAANLVEECIEVESDGDVTTASGAAESFAQEEAEPPEFEELDANKEGESDEEYQPLATLDTRKKSKLVEYLILWKGYGKDEATWEPRSRIASCKQVLKSWEKKNKEAPLQSQAKSKAHKKRKGVQGSNQSKQQINKTEEEEEEMSARELDGCKY